MAVDAGGENSAVRRMFEALRDLHLQAGRPSARAVARLAGDVSHTTVAEALSGRRLPTWPVLDKIVRALEGEADRFRELWTDVEYQRDAQARVAAEADRSARDVLVINGRDEQTRRAMTDFLRAIDLRPLEWENLVRSTGQGAPSLLAVVRTAMAQAQAVLVLLTPDDMAQLRPELETSEEVQRNADSHYQPSPGVLIELGLALGVCPERTIIVEFGALRPVADLAGLSTVRLNSAEALMKLTQRLKSVGCAVDDRGTDWLDRSWFSGIGSVDPQ